MPSFCGINSVSYGLRVAVRACWIVVIVAFFFIFHLTLSSSNTNHDANRTLIINRLLDRRETNNTVRESCLLPSPKLIGWTNISSLTIAISNHKNQLSDEDNEVNMAGVELGGRYEPTECQSRNKIAIVVPYRNRKEHLAFFLRYMHPFLQRQQLSYAIFIVEQSNNGSPFNRGMLMNIGFNEAQLMEHFQCFIFHDVDLLPENDRNPYTCPEDGKPRQMAFSIDKWNNYKPTLRNHFGGVTTLSTNDFQVLNGYSNAFWGWGGEDDQLYERVKLNNMTVTRAFDGQPSLVHLARYKTLSHQKAKPNPDRKRLLLKQKLIEYGYKSDGLSNLKYRRLDLQLKSLYTHVLVNIHQRNNN